MCQRKVRRNGAEARSHWDPTDTSAAPRALCVVRRRLGLDQIDDAIAIRISRRAWAGRSTVVREAVEVLPVNEVGRQSISLDADRQLVADNREPASPVVCNPVTLLFIG